MYPPLSREISDFVGNAYPRNTPKYCLDDVIDFLDNLYDVVFMTYEANITAYGTGSPVCERSFVDGVVPHDIDWVKDRVRWYWEHKLAKPRKTSDPPPITASETEKKGDHTGRDVAGVVPTTTTTTTSAKEVSITA